jgi:hypothetical protein
MRKLSGRVKLTIASALALALVPTSIALAGWGPARPTFTWDKPANYITFNSITDNPYVGDERPFLSGKVTSAPGNVVDNIHVKDNDEVTLRVYFHNNAKSKLNLVATNTRLSILLPKVADTRTWASSYLSADNATPKTVSDTVDFSGDEEFTLSYIPGSARIRTNALNDAQLSDSIVTPDGALLGYDKLDGKVPGCAGFSGYVTIKVKVNMPTKEVPKYACDLLNLNVESGRKVNANVEYSASGGATFKNAKFNWGDGRSTTTTGTSASHTYGKDGNYTVDAILTFNIGQTTQTASCSGKLSFSSKKPPVVTKVSKVTSLPNTGAGGAVGLFAGASALAGIGHYVISRRRA